MLKIIAATGNKGKLTEIKQIFAASGMDVELVSMQAAGFCTEIEENGGTFEDNAFIKAKAVHDALGGVVIADDSGLCVDALGGAPGVHTARFAGQNAADGTNIEKLLRVLNGADDRRAAFVSVVCCMLPDGTSFFTRGVCPGRISQTPQGDGGFGYDPVFVPEGYDETFAQLGEETKNAMSHRAKAVTLMCGELKKRLCAD